MKVDLNYFYFYRRLAHPLDPESKNTSIMANASSPLISLSSRVKKSRKNRKEASFSASQLLNLLDYPMFLSIFSRVRRIDLSTDFTPTSQ